MNKVGTFKITDSFRLTGRGIVALGEILEGKIKIGCYITFNTGTENITMKIADVDFADRISTNEFKIGLTFYYKDDKEKQKFEALKLKEQVCEIISTE